MMITETRWLLSDGTSAPTQDFNIPPAVLLLPSSFDNTDAGTYICSPNNNQNDPSRDTIALNTGSKYVVMYVCVYMGLMYSADWTHGLDSRTRLGIF